MFLFNARISCKAFSLGND